MQTEQHLVGLALHAGYQQTTTRCCHPQTIGKRQVAHTRTLLPRVVLGHLEVGLVSTGVITIADATTQHGDPQTTIAVCCDVIDIKTGDIDEMGYFVLLTTLATKSEESSLLGAKPQGAVLHLIHAIDGSQKTSMALM